MVSVLAKLMISIMVLIFREGFATEPKINEKPTSKRIWFKEIKDIESYNNI